MIRISQFLRKKRRLARSNSDTISSTLLVKDRTNRKSFAPSAVKKQLASPRTLRSLRLKKQSTPPRTLRPLRLTNPVTTANDKTTRLSLQIVQLEYC